MTRRWRDRLLTGAMLAPALALMALLFGASAVYGVAQSLGYLPVIGQERLSLDAYAALLSGQGPAGREFWPSLAFSLWVSGASTLLSAAGALLLTLPAARRSPGTEAGGAALNLSLAFPHLVWAVGLLLLLGQSGLLARGAAALGLIERPADFPVLVRDRYGIGIILNYVTKEIPFLALIVLAVLRGQPAGYDLAAENLGATPLQRLRFVTLPLVLPALAAGALLVFAFVLGAYEAPALLGVRYPRMLSVLALEFFTNPDLRSRAEGMAISLVMAALVVAVALLGRRSQNRMQRSNAEDAEIPAS
ncbi:MAG TPA: ABC transporter permease subunit [Roseiflexaceae bacterium]|nr:ABC transporter permease subunit [Roseiflexaceae bacterium]